MYKRLYLNSIKSLYEHATCTVRPNSIYSESLNVKIGLKQGCILSPQLFNMLANDLINAINTILSISII